MNNDQEHEKQVTGLDKRGRNLKAESLRHLALIYAYWDIRSREGEVWKPVPNYETSYEVSNFGRVKSRARAIPRPDGNGSLNLLERILMPSVEKKGYLAVGLSRESETVHFKVHKLVAEAFVANPEQKPFVNHINGIKADNRAANLEWVTASESIFHAHLHGLMPDIRGESNGSAKLNAKTVRDIRQRVAQGHATAKQLAVEFGVSTSAIHRILTRVTWTQV